MPLKEHVYSVMIVSSSDRFNDNLCRLLPEAVYSPVCVASSVGEAQRNLQQRAYELIIVNSPLPDDFGKKLAIDSCIGQSSASLLLVKSELYEETYVKVFESGVFTLRKPVSSSMMLQALDWMRAARERLRKLEKKTVSLEDKMSEIRTVNRAKWALIEAREMTEADAHRYIEKQAMDRCVTRREIAEEVLQTYKQG